jgi:hypothetical protein
MILLNFSHPITDEQKAQIEALIHQPVERIIHIPAQFDHQQPYLPQLAALIERIPLEPQALQSAPLLVNLPSFNVIAALLLAELHGRMGYFPPIVRMKPVEGAVPPRYEAAEILNLQGVRDKARRMRF